MQITIQDCFCKEIAGGLQAVHARFKGPFDNAPGNAGTWRAAFQKQVPLPHGSSGT